MWFAWKMIEMICGEKYNESSYTNRQRNLLPVKTDRGQFTDPDAENPFAWL